MEQHSFFGTRRPLLKAARFAFLFFLTFLAGALTQGQVIARSDRHTGGENHPYPFVGGVPACTPPPVELKSFRVTPKPSSVRIAWTTASETKSDWFAVERSQNLHTFEPIGVVAVAGDSRKPSHYALLDEAPLPGTSYYRLRQIDLDGTERVYRPVAVVRGGSGGSGTVFPNPTSGRSVSVVVNDPATARITLQTLQGSVLGTQIVCDETTPVLRLSATQLLQPGVYLLVIRESTGVRSERWVVR